MEFKHRPVLLEETIESLKIRPDGIYVDGTLGGAGHASQVCKRLSEKGRFVGIDQDDCALQAAGERLKEFGKNVRIDCVKSNYCQMKSVLENLGIDKVDGILCLISGFPRISWITRSGDLPTGKMHRWI